MPDETTIEALSARGRVIRRWATTGCPAASLDSQVWPIEEPARYRVTYPDGSVESHQPGDWGLVGPTVHEEQIHRVRQAKAEHALGLGVAPGALGDPRAVAESVWSDVCMDLAAKTLNGTVTPYQTAAEAEADLAVLAPDLSARVLDNGPDWTIRVTRTRPGFGDCSAQIGADRSSLGPGTLPLYLRGLRAYLDSLEPVRTP